MIDDALSTGDFHSVDELYVNIVNGTCRHINHSGPNRYPSKKDKCAVQETIVDRKATELKLQEWREGNCKGRKPKPIKRTVYRCKRRKPQPFLIVLLYISIRTKKSSLNSVLRVMTSM